ncbi:hypothetical protein [Geoalkalibacter subterraneus]|uniref:hypothetical protein n=1 Tax=Geoalkalibacter subterraneus TaxID=483547 RepID=UPI00118535C5|nr:hypothetical protein [Geoalkalibacter subterraneus]
MSGIKDLTNFFRHLFPTKPHSDEVGFDGEVQRLENMVVRPILVEPVQCVSIMVYQDRTLRIVRVVAVNSEIVSVFGGVHFVNTSQGSLWFHPGEDLPDDSRLLGLP